MVEKKFDIVSGVVFLITGAVIFIRSKNLLYFSEFGPGPGFLPTWLGVFICLLSLNLIISSTIRKNNNDKRSEKSTAFLGKNKVAKVILALSAYLLILTSLGFIFATYGLIIYLLKYVEDYSWKFSVIVSGLISIFFYTVFNLGLKVPLPTGFLGL